MIEFIKSFLASDGSLHADLTKAQEREISILLTEKSGLEIGPELADCIVKNRDKIIDILTTNSSSRPKARKVNGGKKARKKEQPQPAPQL